MSTFCDRPLTAVEAAGQLALAPALSALAGYLTACGAWGELAAAEDACSPLVPRQRADGPGRDDEYPETVTALFVHPRMAWEWMRVRDPGLGVSPGVLAEAVTFLGGRAAVTVLGRDEWTRRSPWRGRRVAGWYRMSREMVGRAMLGPHTPVLTPLPGRVGGAEVAPVPRGVADRRAAMWLDPDSVLRIVQGFLVDAEPTVLVGVARDQGRPLVPRRRGRPRRGGFGLDAGAAMLPMSGLWRFARREAGRLAVPCPQTETVLRLGVQAVAQSYTSAVEVRDRVSGPDLEREATQRYGWVYCRVVSLGRPPWDVESLRAELADYRLASGDRPVPGDRA